jgi:hypothetical protein
MDAEYQKVDALPRPEAASKRTTLGKLMKDFDKVKVHIQAILNEASLVKIVNERGEVESFARTSSVVTSSGAPTPPAAGSAGGAAPSWGRGGASFADQNEEPPRPPMSKQEQAQHIQQLKLKPLLQGQEVDDAILEERERDIKKMNHDLVLVNEMFKYVSGFLNVISAHSLPARCTILCA